jgi:hypothetical protein
MIGFRRLRLPVMMMACAELLSEIGAAGAASVFTREMHACDN